MKRLSIASIAVLALAAVSLAPAQSPSAINPLYQNTPPLQQVGGQDLSGNSYFGKSVWMEQQAYSNGLTIGMPIAAPAAPAGVPGYTTGTVAAGSNYATCVAVDWAGNLGTPSAVSSLVTTSNTGFITWTCTPVTNAAYYQVWVNSSTSTPSYFLTTTSLSNVAVQTLPIASNTSGTINTAATSGASAFNGRVFFGQGFSDASAGVLTASMTAQTTATLTNITGMAWTIQNSKNYKLACDIIVLGAASSTLQFGINGSGTAPTYMSDVSGPTGAALAWGDLVQAQQTSWQQKTTATGAIGANTGDFKVYYLIQGGAASGGTLTLQTAANGTNAITVTAGSSCILTQLN